MWIRDSTGKNYNKYILRKSIEQTFKMLKVYNICDLIRRMNILNELHSQIAILFFIKRKNKEWQFRVKNNATNQI